MARKQNTEQVRASRGGKESGKMWEGISARKDNLPELKTRDESRKRDERTRERRLKRDALIINPLSHMQPPSSSFVWEQGLSFADPVL